MSGPGGNGQEKCWPRPRLSPARSTSGEPRADSNLQRSRRPARAPANTVALSRAPRPRCPPGARTGERMVRRANELTKGNRGRWGCNGRFVGSRAPLVWPARPRPGTHGRPIPWLAAAPRGRAVLLSERSAGNRVSCRDQPEGSAVTGRDIGTNGQLQLARWLGQRRPLKKPGTTVGNAYRQARRGAERKAGRGAPARWRR